MTENPFHHRYKTTDSSELLDIVDNANDYQPLAVEAALLELDNRQLTAEQLKEEKAKQASKRQEKAGKEQIVKDIEDKVTSVGSSLYDYITPIQTDSLTTDKFIRNISLFLGGLTLFQIYKELGMLKFMFTNTSAKWDFSMVLYFLPLLFVPTAGILFWLRKKNGWILTTLYFAYTAAGAISLFIMELKRKPTGFAVFDDFFTRTTPLTYILILIAFSGMTWWMTKKSIREVYNIDNKTIYATIIAGVSIPLLMILTLR